MINKTVCPWAIILAAGQGLRLTTKTSGKPKQFILYQDLPLYYHSAKTFSRNARMQGIVFVFPSDHLEAEKARLNELEQNKTLGLKWHCVAGGPRRQDSVYEGLKALPPTCTHAIIHDSARPFMSAQLVEDICLALDAGHMGVVPGLAITDTIKNVQDEMIIQTIDRSNLFTVQTPQGFERHALEKAHIISQSKNLDVTDDASLLEYCNHPVYMIKGDEQNIKITEARHMHLLQNQPTTRLCSGFGYDVHRFGKGRPLKLGGVLMDGKLEVEAHSDGDVLLHALMDAMLGCAALGDIGQHFPDTDAHFNNADSAVLLSNVLQMLSQKHIKITGVDLTIITQKPKIGPQRAAIAKNIAYLLHIPVQNINVKATTEEGLGFTGNGEGIKAIALVNAIAYS